jgi:alkylated DNA nucleotide flippase Atl1
MAISPLPQSFPARALSDGSCAPTDLPWHRVITASGRPARHLTTRQLELLRAEGVLAVDGKIALNDVRYEFPD